MDPEPDALMTKRRWITFLCLILAIACYAVGAALPGSVLIVAGLVFELTFLYRLLGGGRDRDES